MAEVNIVRGFIKVPVYIKPRESYVLAYMDYKVDTGANLTTIGKEDLSALGYDEAWIKTGKLLVGNERPTVASGVHLDDCYEVILPEIQIGGWVGQNWPFVTSLSMNFRLLLGTNSLQFFNWHIDYGHGVCRYELIPGKRRLVFGQKEQSIHALDELQDMQ